jgi:nucleolar MIF4G domain-containing protein 1
MNETLLDLLYASLVGPVLSSERIILEHVMLIAILHANVGTEIGAFFIQNFVQRFHKLYEEVESLEGNRKEMENLALLYSYMYHFKVREMVSYFGLLLP